MAGINASGENDNPNFRAPIQSIPLNAENSFDETVLPVKKLEILLIKPSTGLETFTSKKALSNQAATLPANPDSSKPVNNPLNVLVIIVPISNSMSFHSIPAINSPIFFPSSSQGISFASLFKAPSKLVKNVLSFSAFSSHSNVSMNVVIPFTILSTRSFHSNSSANEASDVNAPFKAVAKYPAISPKEIVLNTPFNPCATEVPIFLKSRPCTKPPKVSHAMRNLFPIRCPRLFQFTSSKRPSNPSEILLPRFTQSIPSAS